MKKVAIAGAQPITRENAPFNDKTFDIWGLSDWLIAPWMKRCDLLFEMHLSDIYMNHPRTPEYWDALQEAEMPVYMYPVADPRVKNSVLYPMGDILKMVSSGTNMGEPFKPLNCSIAYAVALAIHLEYEQIDVYGVELASTGERFAPQQPIFAFWAGVAVSKGIELNVNCSKGLFTQPLYGSENTKEMAKLDAYLKALEKDRVKYQKALDMTEGAKNIIARLAYGEKNV